MMSKRKLITHFEQQANNAIDALFNWRSLLRTWQNDPRLIPDDMFMAHLDDLAEVGLLEFVDGSDLDRLRELMTGQEV
ncbi:MAG: hypothetical protein KDJ52_01760 [Anaerolineae bacterium]|nr:hypothetical protein [Anaerolineae bacterium]